MQKIKASLAILAIVGGTMLAPTAANAGPVTDAKIAAASTCPWWVANGYWRVIWWLTHPGECR
jgi:hypothetical protein